MCDSNYQVDGEWGEFEFRTIVKLDYPIVLKHIRDVFCKTEPLLSCVGYTDELANDLCSYVQHGLDKQNGLSFMAIHKESQKVAGVRVTYKIEKDEKSPELTLTSETLKKALYNIIDISKTASIFDRYAVNHYAELLIASIDPEFRERGLATEMYRRTLTLLQSRGYPVAESSFTSPITRKIATKFGFEELLRRYFKDFKDENGDKFIHNAGDDQFAALMAIRLIK